MKENKIAAIVGICRIMFAGVSKSRLVLQKKKKSGMINSCTILLIITLIHSMQICKFTETLNYYRTIAHKITKK